MTDNLKYCMCGCIYEQANCPNCNKTPDRELIARVRDTDNPICDTDRIAAADRIEALVREAKAAEKEIANLRENYDAVFARAERLEALVKERDELIAWKRHWSGEIDVILAGRADEYDRAEAAEAKRDESERVLANLTVEFEAAEAEVARLREALQEIAGMDLMSASAVAFNALKGDSHD
jgi:chromosome segregation ATPase